MPSSWRSRVPTLLLLALAAGASPARGAVDSRVAIVSTSSIGPFVEAGDAITKALRQNQPQPEILTFDLDGDQRNAPAVLARVRASDPALLVTIGSLATAVVLAEKWDVPIVFSMVLYPEQTGFRAGTRAVTGATLDIPLDHQFATLRRLLPDARRVGVLYSRGETGAVVVAARAAATRHGFTLNAREVEQPAKALGVLGELMDEVDVVWSVADSHVFAPQTTSPLILDALRRGKPVFGLSLAHVRIGTLAALYCDYRDVGVQSAELVVRVLRGEKAAEIATTAPRRVRLALNLRTAHNLGLTVAPDVERDAAEVIR